MAERPGVGEEPALREPGGGRGAHGGQPLLVTDFAADEPAEALVVDLESADPRLLSDDRCHRAERGGEHRCGGREDLAQLGRADGEVAHGEKADGEALFGGQAIQEVRVVRVEIPGRGWDVAEPVERIRRGGLPRVVAVEGRGRPDRLPAQVGRVQGVAAGALVDQGRGRVGPVGLAAVNRAGERRENAESFRQVPHLRMTQRRHGLERAGLAEGRQVVARLAGQQQHGARRELEAGQLLDEDPSRIGRSGEGGTGGAPAHPSDVVQPVDDEHDRSVREGAPGFLDGCLQVLDRGCEARS